MSLIKCLFNGVTAVCFAALALVGCNPGTPPDELTATSEIVIARAVQGTVSFIMTETALAVPTSTPTITFTPSNTFTPSATFTASNTFTPTATFTASNTFTPTATFTLTFTPSATYTASSTFTPTVTPTPTDTQPPIATSTPTVEARTESSTSLTGDAYRTLGNTRVRSCTNTTCGVLTTLPANALVEVIAIAEGAAVAGNTRWLEVVLDGGQTGFIHGSLARAGSNPVVFAQPAQPTQPAQATPLPANALGGGGSTTVIVTEAFTSIPPTQPGSQWTCAGDQYNCGSFGSRNEMLGYWNACPGDPSRLDGDNDGIPCESLR